MSDRARSKDFWTSASDEDRSKKCELAAFRVGALTDASAFFIGIGQNQFATVNGLSLGREVSVHKAPDAFASKIAIRRFSVGGQGGVPNSGAFGVTNGSDIALASAITGRMT